MSDSAVTSESLLPQRFLFRFAAPCQHRHPLWKPSGAGLDERFRLVSLGELEDEPALAEISAAWSEAGLVFVAKVSGKKQPIWCRASRAEDSDGLQLWIDTRDVHNVHRASRFCHRFIFLPSAPVLWVAAKNSMRHSANRCPSTARKSPPGR